jgi:hypothetical protein
MTDLNVTAAFLGPRAQWPAAHLALRDVQGLWGGCTLDLDGDGRGSATMVDRAGTARPYPLTLGPERAAALFEKFIASDFLSLTFPMRPGRPDEARPVISVTNPAGASRAIAKWAGDDSPAFDAVYQALLALVREAAGGTLAG